VGTHKWFVSCSSNIFIIKEYVCELVAKNNSEGQPTKKIHIHKESVKELPNLIALKVIVAAKGGKAN
jgi:hypothetical protein